MASQRARLTTVVGGARLYERNQAAELLPGTTLSERRVTPLRGVLWSNDLGRLCRTETGYARDAGPEGAAKGLALTESKAACRKGAVRLTQRTFGRVG
jgi:hypothetical protein